MVLPWSRKRRVPMAEAVWSGFLRLSLVSCPVHLTAATTDKHVIRLEQLNSRTGNPVAQQSVDTRTGDAVNPEAVVQGYRTVTANYVRLTDSELESLASE